MLEVDNLHLSFGGLKALQGVNFCADIGHITGVIGPNGAGKTSLFNAISGFYTDFTSPPAPKSYPPC